MVLIGSWTLKYCNRAIVQCTLTLNYQADGKIISVLTTSSLSFIGLNVLDLFQIV